MSIKMSAAEAKRLGLTVAEKRHKWNGTEPGATRKEAAVNKARLFETLCEAHGLPIPIDEYPFAKPERDFRFDWLFDGWLAIEIQGGNWKGGRHTRPAELVNEYAKVNLAVCLGYSVLLCTPEQIESGEIFPVIKRALACEGDQS